MALDISLIFRVINFIVAAFIIIGGVATIIKGFPNFIQGIFCIIFGAVTVLFEFRLPKQVTRYASFMFGFGGRAIFYIFIGGITLNYGGLSIACGIIVLLTGVVYLVLEFVPGVQAPTNMQMESFEESMGYGTRPAGATENHVLAPAAASEPYSNTSSPYPTKTYVSDGAVV